ncbi:MAG TPA: ABC transporter substrate-binding protein [Pyrinomonadaceae bacterium]|nr:ABC transporter substrate-binding protein [Pyrinomonadaceae bacterium]
MTRRLKLAALLLAAVFGCGVAARSVASQSGRVAPAAETAPAAQTGAASTAATARPPTEQERRGKALYLRGTSASGREVTAVVGELDVPGATLTCAGCHGARAEGKSEGGVTAGNLTWSNLVKPYGHTHPSGRKHGAFDEASFARAVVGGVDPAGNELAVAMPRYRISAEDMADLVAYLKRIEFERDPGLSDERVRVGTILHSAGALAPTAAAMRDVLRAYFDDLNERGGIYNRRIELTAAEAGPAAESVIGAARRLTEGEGVFAFVGGVSAGADAELAAFATEHEVPFLGPATLLPQTGAPLNRHVFYLLPGLPEMSRALANFAAARPGLKGAPAAVVYSETPLGRAAADAAADQAAKAGLGRVARHSFRPGEFDAGTLAARLKADGVTVVFVFPAGGEDASLIKEAAAAGWAPHVLLPGVLAARDLTEAVPAALKDRVFLAFPTVPSDVSPGGLAELRGLLGKYRLEARHMASQLAALAAAKVFVEGLKRAGRGLTREGLLTALEGLYDYDSGVTPRLTFGPNRRVGAAGAHIVTVDPEKKEYAVAAGWVSAN